MHEEFIKDYFKFDCEPLANLDAMVVGECYRFTVLTSRLIRMEYAVDNKFQDRPSQTFWFRSLPVPSFTVNNSNGVLSIETDALILTYRVGKPFSGSSLRIQIKASKKIWKYGQKDRGNLEGTARTLDGTSGFSFMEKGLMSKNGFIVVDDSKTLTFN